MSKITHPAEDGVLLVGHGTRDRLGVEEFLRLAELVRAAITPRPMEACFLEIAEPTIAAGIARLIGRAARRITVVPLLLTAAGHAKRDIPRAVQEALGSRTFAIRQTAALDCHPRLLDLSTRRYDEALAGRPEVPPRQTLLLLVGRGSSDAAAIVTVRRFAALRGERSNVGRVETCFAAVARPSLGEMLPLTASLGFRRIVVQPHLLFQGLLFSEIRHAVDTFAAAESSRRATDVGQQMDWIVVDRLGPEAELADAVVERIERACIG